MELGLVADMLHTDQMDLSWTEVKRQETLENLLVAKASSLEKKLRLIETKEFTENINDQWKKKKKGFKVILFIWLLILQPVQSTVCD